MSIILFLNTIESESYCYKQALAECAGLSPDNDVRLAIHLNYSVFYREVL